MTIAIKHLKENTRNGNQHTFTRKSTNVYLSIPKYIFMKYRSLYFFLHYAYDSSQWNNKCQNIDTTLKVCLLG